MNENRRRSTAPRGRRGRDAIIIESRAAYDDRKTVFDALHDEVVYIIKQAVSESSIKIHDVESRVKTYESLRKKQVERIGDSSSDIISDIVGARIICLFRSDLDELRKIVEQEFIVISSDDKTQGGDDTFGYMSVHYICKMRDEFQGRRYDAIKNIEFEIQIRTLCMHAWSAISHYLDYKAEWDIPSHLRKDLNALSALFYLADSQYEQLFKARQASAQNAAANELRTNNEHTPLNLDTLNAFLEKKYPDRPFDKGSLSKLTGELLEASVTTIEDLEIELDKRKAEFAKSEAQRRQGPYNAIGVVRVSLHESHPAYKEVYQRTQRLRQARRRNSS